MTLKEIEEKQIELDKERAKETPLYVVLNESARLEIGTHIVYASLSAALEKKREYKILKPKIFCFLLSHEVQS